MAFRQDYAPPVYALAADTGSSRWSDGGSEELVDEAAAPLDAEEDRPLALWLHFNHSLRTRDQAPPVLVALARRLL